jgi:hypothetical protein
MRSSAIVILATALLAAPTVNAQWAKALHPSVPRTRAGDANLSAPAPKTRERKVDLSGVWLADRVPLPKEAGLTVEGDLQFPPHFINVTADIPPEQVPFQPWAAELFQQRLASTGDHDPAAHCKPSGLPILNATPVPLKIVQTPGLVVILYEENTVFRQIFLDGRKTVEDPEPRFMGYSTGKWDGDELVVDTVGFNDRHRLDAMGHPISEKLHLTERFRRRDAGHLEIETTIDDPGAYTKPFTYTIKSTLMPEDDLLEYFCAENEKDAQHYQ